MTTSLHYNNLDSVKKKLVNKIIYNKSYLKNSEFSKTLYTLDNYYNSSFFTQKKITSLNFANSINSAPNIFTNKLNKEIKFQLNTCVFSKCDLNLDKFSKVLESGKNLTKKFSTLIFLKVVKGGYKCYYFGLLGFLPRSQAKNSFKNLSKSIKRIYDLQKFKNFLMLFKTPSTLIEKNLIRVSSFALNNLSLYPTFKKKNFSSFRKKPKIFFGDVNVVFIFKTIK